MSTWLHQTYHMDMWDSAASRCKCIEHLAERILMLPEETQDFHAASATPAHLALRTAV